MKLNDPNFKTIKSTIRFLLPVLTFLMLTPSFAFANMGIPMIFLTLPGMIIGLIPIIAFETWVAIKSLNTKVKETIITVTLANLLSTLIGTPLVWGIHLLICGAITYPIAVFFPKTLNTLPEFFLGLYSMTICAPWLGGHKNPTITILLVSGAALFLLIPFFYISWWSEYQVWKRFFGNLEAKLVLSTCRKANIYSYFMLAVFVLIFGAYAYLDLN